MALLSGDKTLKRMPKAGSKEEALAAGGHPQGDGEDSSIDTHIGNEGGLAHHIFENGAFIRPRKINVERLPKAHFTQSLSFRRINQGMTLKPGEKRPSEHEPLDFGPGVTVAQSQEFLDFQTDLELHRDSGDPVNVFKRVAEMKERNEALKRGPTDVQAASQAEARRRRQEIAK